ncbi:hypothetical protein AYI69_g552 [Smittium culicis]|uniref:Uncharacterized protein n=1 Tax=Smittium culicis TaxID=133412 RepID=A0A1R1YSS2_9FUNG|nr:hypothetical protein AYI69_g552 [Smittium culicis]
MLLNELIEGAVSFDGISILPRFGLNSLYTKWFRVLSGVLLDGENVQSNLPSFGTSYEVSDSYAFWSRILKSFVV